MENEWHPAKTSTVTLAVTLLMAAFEVAVVPIFLTGVLLELGLSQGFGLWALISAAWALAVTLSVLTGLSTLIEAIRLLAAVLESDRLERQALRDLEGE